MELDDLKQNWNKQTENELKNLNKNFMEMIHNKSYGPLAVLKSKTQNQLIVFVIAICLLLFIFFKKPDLWYFTNFIFLCVIFMADFFWKNYRLIQRLQNMESSVKETIEKTIKGIESNFRNYFWVSRAYFLIVVAVIEILMLKDDKNFEIWHNYSFIIRISIYAVIFLIIYFIGKYTYKNQYKKHIVYLKELLEKIK